jgi:signal transduction histidine kinase
LQDCDLNNVIAEAIGHLANDFQARNIELQRSGDRELPLIHADGILLVQVVLNLLGNARDAVSQNPEGQRIVNISSSANEEDIVITIEDNGAGVTGDPERIFDPFVTSKKSGMGMGLAISKSIIEAHGGKISCKSTVGSGTVFKVSIPQKSAMS